MTDFDGDDGQRKPVEPWLSVLVPAHNAGPYIEACMHSILGQVDGGVELIALEDGSTDDTWTSMQRVAVANPRRVRLLRAERGRGVSAARNALLAEARGRYVWFVDADDLIAVGAVAQLRQLVERNDPDLVMCDFRYLKQRRMSRPQCSFAGRADQLLHDRSTLVAGLLYAGELHVWSKIAKRTVWQQAPFPQDRHFEDIAVVLPLIRNTRSYIHVHCAWVSYRQHSASIMATITPTKAGQWIASVEELHRGLSDEMQAMAPTAIRALDYFALKNFASVLRRIDNLQGEHAMLRNELESAYRRMFPQGSAAILRDWRRRGWLLRAIRTRRTLRRYGLE